MDVWRDRTELIRSNLINSTSQVKSWEGSKFSPLLSEVFWRTSSEITASPESLCYLLQLSIQDTGDCISLHAPWTPKESDLAVAVLLWSKSCLGFGRDLVREPAGLSAYASPQCMNSSFKQETPEQISIGEKRLERRLPETGVRETGELCDGYWAFPPLSLTLLNLCTAKRTPPCLCFQNSFQ